MAGTRLAKRTRTYLTEVAEEVAEFCRRVGAGRQCHLRRAFVYEPPENQTHVTLCVLEVTAPRSRIPAARGDAQMQWQKAGCDNKESRYGLGLPGAAAIRANCRQEMNGRSFGQVRGCVRAGP